MTRIEKRVLIRNTLLGIVLTLIVLVADWKGKDGWLARVENNLYDLRARKFQYYTPLPTDQIIHVSIDDPSLQYIGQWPWRRSMLAELTDEMHKAGAKAIGFDVLFSEEQESYFEPVGAAAEELTFAQTRLSSLEGKFVRVNEDTQFARALADFGNAILPAALTTKAVPSQLHQDVVQVLMDGPLMTTEEVHAKLAAKGAIPESSETVFSSVVTSAKKEVIYAKLVRLLDTRTTEAEVQTLKLLDAYSMLFPGQELVAKKLLPPGLFEQQFRRASSFRLLRRLARPIPPNLPPLLPVSPDLPPIPELAFAATATAFVDHLSDADGVARSIELWRNCDGWLYPQLGMRLACAWLGVKIEDIEIYADHIVIPKPDGTRLTVPVFSQATTLARYDCGMFMPIPWFGPSQRSDDWTRMYDRPGAVSARQFLPMVKVWEILDARDKVRHNSRELDEAIGTILELSNPGKLERYEELKLRQKPDDVTTRIEWLDGIVEAKEHEAATFGLYELSEEEVEEQLKGAPAGERKKIDAALAAYRNIGKLRRETLDMLKQVDVRRAWLKNEMNGKAVLVGFTATGRVDVVPTSLMPSCPGPVVHGVVFNAIVTEDVWTRASPWITRGLTLLVGIIATATVAYFQPVPALLTSLAMAVGYVFFNGLLLFDYHNTIVGVAGPLVAIALVWSGCTLMRFVVERAERRHIENRFRSYVDPALVNFVIENPDKIHLEGESREMTVVFTDLAGFTTISEKLKERVVPILNEYMQRMVNIIRNPTMPSKRQGYRNKFLGDGIMFFFGAPYPNAKHAVDAVATVLKMQLAMFDFNKWLEAQDLPAVKMRAGISTGKMVVGDAGSPDASDYTVLGDDVNFGARLESANKATGTLVMVSQRTREMCGDLYLFRPIARLQVVGKSQSVQVFEPICYHEEATEDHHKLVAMTNAMIDTFVQSKFVDCIERIRELDEAFGTSKLAQLYRRNCENYLAEPPGADFIGTIVLSEK